MEYELVQFEIPKDAKIIWNSFFYDAPIQWRLQDLFAIKFANGDVLDMGWYPDSDKNGEYYALIVDQEDWDKPPLDEFETKDCNLMKQWIQERINERIYDLPERQS